MRLSARNQFTGTVEAIQMGAVMATVVVKLDGSEHRITSAVTRASVEELGLSIGSSVTTVIKSTEVILGVE